MLCHVVDAAGCAYVPGATVAASTVLPSLAIDLTLSNDGNPWFSVVHVSPPFMLTNTPVKNVLTRTTGPLITMAEMLRMSVPCSVDAQFAPPFMLL